MKKYISLLIIFFIFFNIPVLIPKVISPSYATPIKTSSQPKLTPIKPFEIFKPDSVKISSQAKLPPLPPILNNPMPQAEQKTPQVQPQSGRLFEPATESATEPSQKIEYPLKLGTSADVSVYKKISLPEAIDYAMSNNLGIKATRLETDKAKNDVKAAGRLQNPRIESFLNMGQAAIDNPDYLGFFQPIELFKRSARKNLAKSNLVLTRGNVLLAELNLRLDVRQAYINLVTAKSVMKILDGQRQLLQELLNIAQRKYEVGSAPQMDVIQAKMALNQLLIQLNSARTDVLVARYKFNLLLQTRDFDTQEDYLPQEKKFLDLLTPHSGGKIPPFEAICCIAMEKRLDVKNARQDIDVAKKNLTMIIRKRIPDIEIGAGVLYVPPGLSTSGNATTGVLLLGNILNIPLLYQYTPEIKNAKIQVEQKELIYKNTQHLALMNLHSAYVSFSTAQANLNYYNDIILSESDQFLHMAKRSYQVGKTNMTSLVYIEQSYKNILMNYTNALATYYNAWIDVLREVNDEGLELNG